MGYGTLRPQMRSIPYEPSKDEFLDFMDWGSLKDVPSEYTSNIFRSASNRRVGRTSIHQR